MAESINVTHGAFSIGTNQPILAAVTTATPTTTTTTTAALSLAAATTSPTAQRKALCTECTCKRTTTAATSTPTLPIQLDGINTLFFDLDNTLIPTRAGDLKAIRKLSDVLENQFAFSKEESASATQAFLKAFRRCPDNSQTSLDSWRTYLWREALPNRYKHLAEQIYPKWLQLRYRYLAMPTDFVQMLRRFREARFLLALITNGPSNAQWEKINRLNVSQHFDCVLVSSDLPWEKPHPNIFHAACNFLGVKPAECAMIGDKLETDIKGGRITNLGATFWIPLGTMETNLEGVEHTPHVILRQLVDLCKYFPALHGPAASGSAVASGSSAFRRRNSCFCGASAGSSMSVYPSSSSAAAARANDRRFYGANYQRQTDYRNSNYQHENKYRRGGSMPAIECTEFGSETENSCDSFIE